MSFDDALVKGITDIWTFNCGRRPLISKESLYHIIMNRFDWADRG